MTEQEFDELTPYQQEQLRFQGWVVVAMERLYDLLLAGLYQEHGEQFVSDILADHREHKYMFPEPESNENET